MSSVDLERDLSDEFDVKVLGNLKIFLVVFELLNFNENEKDMMV